MHVRSYFACCILSLPVFSRFCLLQLTENKDNAQSSLHKCVCGGKPLHALVGPTLSYHTVLPVHPAAPYSQTSPAHWRGTVLDLPWAPDSLGHQLCHAGTCREKGDMLAVCVPGSHLFGLCWKAGLCDTAGVCPSPRVQPRLSVQFLNLEAKPSRKDGLFRFSYLKYI